MYVYPDRIASSRTAGFLTDTGRFGLFSLTFSRSFIPKLGILLCHMQTVLFNGLQKFPTLALTYRNLVGRLRYGQRLMRYPCVQTQAADKIQGISTSIRHYWLDVIVRKDRKGFTGPACSWPNLPTQYRRLDCACSQNN